MQRWKISVFFGICLAVMLISCVALLLHSDDDDVDLVGDRIDPPLRPLSSTSHSISSKKNLDQSHRQHSNAHSHSHNHPRPQDEPRADVTVELDPDDRQNYRKRFSDAIRGVFRDLINSKNSTSTTTPESTENNSSRLKRQLDFTSTSDENENVRTSAKPASAQTTRRTTLRFTTKKPIIRILQVNDAKDASTSASAVDSDENKVESSSSVENLPSKEARTSSRRFRPRLRELNPPSNERYDIASEESPKNFTYEVVQVERKVVRKEDGHIPAYFTKGQKFNIEPRLAKVEKKEVQNRPSVLYRKNWSPEQKTGQSVNRRGRPSGEDSTENSPKSGAKRGSQEDESSQEKRVVINLDQQLPYNDRDLSHEDLKDYHDGHSTFGSKGNFTHTIISRNVAGFIPNNAENAPPQNKDSLKKRAGQGPADRKFVIEKGKVTERYPSRERESPFDSPEIEIYTVPGGRSSTESYSRESVKKKELTSPEVPTSFEELFKQGHPGVVRAPQNGRGSEEGFQRRQQNSQPFGEEYSNPFPYNPLVDDPPLKFDPESDRFYGNPKPDTEKLAQPNSPVSVENDHPSRERERSPGPGYQEFFKPLKRGRSAEDEGAPVDDRTTQNSAELPLRNQPDDRFYYDRAYNPPDYTTDYDNAGDGNRERGDTEPNTYDFVGLDENFERQNSDHGIPDDFFDFPGDPGERGLGGFRQRGDNSRESGERDRGNNDYDSTTEREDPRRNHPPPDEPPPRRGNNPDYDNAGSREDYGGFGSGTGLETDRTGGAGTEDGPENFDTGFFQTLKQFDEEIKKLQDEERKKLLHTSPLPEEQRAPQQTPGPVSTTSGYKRQEPPLVISSPGPLENADGDSTTLRLTDEDGGSPPSESAENLSREDTTVSNNSSAGDDGEEEEGEDEEEIQANRSTVGPESSTEKSGEEGDDEEGKKK